MQFIPKQPRIEAEKVSLSGQDLMAVVVDDAAHLVSGEVFRLFFQVRPVGDVKTARKAVKKARVSAAGEVGIASASEGITYSAAVRQAVAELPRTATEIKHRVEVITGRKPAQDLVSALLSQMRAKGHVTKRDDLKWYPVSGGGLNAA